MKRLRDAWLVLTGQAFASRYATVGGHQDHDRDATFAQGGIPQGGTTTVLNATGKPVHIHWNP